MADETVLHIGENSPEHVAYRLMREIAEVERIAIHAGELDPKWTRAGRAWILNTYQECLYAVKNPRRPAHLGS
ncbi:MAG TPA: hypothetical protein VMB34_32615 [Acetobacteraceae bacterium]|nr:hypothetical protein [Acetobacteraceae bacterium]